MPRNNCNQLTDISKGYDTDRLIFMKPDEEPGPTYINYRVKIKSRNPDGTVGDFIFHTPGGSDNKVFSYGVQEDLDPNDKTKRKGWKFPVCLQERGEELTEAQATWVESFNAIVESIKDHIMEVKDEVSKKYLTRPELRKLNPLFYKKIKDEKGRATDEIAPDAVPTLYPKLIYSKKYNKFFSRFFSPSGKEIDPMDMCESRWRTNTVLRLESVFIGSQVISLRITVVEAEVEEHKTGQERFLCPSQPDENAPSFLQSNTTRSFGVKQPKPNDDDDDDDSGSDSDGSLAERDEPPAPPPVEKPKIKRVPKKIIKKPPTTE